MTGFLAGLAIRDTAGFVAGVLFLLVGLAAIGVSGGYTVGTLLHMGPGYFPVVLGALLVIIGVASMVRAVAVTTMTPDTAAVRIALRPLLVVGAAVLVFAGGIDRIGLIPSVFATALLACMAGPKPKLLEGGLIAAALSAMAAGIFFYGLKLPFTLF
ncbi:MAG: putative tricarboxylic transport rane protein [Acetobacteraceae bacterium]|jgi:Tripartite tricarboxylate transporter TctB family|nr:putative tricarboxylic transport rane protein [Acetobacteraceae bacterium]